MWLSVKHSACGLWKHLRNIPALNRTASAAFSVLNKEIQKRWRAEQEQEHENIKCSKINFLGGSSRCGRIFGAG